MHPILIKLHEQLNNIGPAIIAPPFTNQGPAGSLVDAELGALADRFPVFHKDGNGVGAGLDDLPDGHADSV